MKCSIKFIEKIDGKTKKIVVKSMSEFAQETKATKKFKGVIVTSADLKVVKGTPLTHKKPFNSS